MYINKFWHHLILWIVITATFTISKWSYSNTFKDALIFELLFLPSRIIAVYLNWFFLIPKYLYKNKFLKYLLILIGTIVMLSFLQRVFVLLWGYPTFFPEWVDEHQRHFFKPTRIMQNALIITSPVAFTIGWRLFIDWREKQKTAEILLREKTETELKYLKSQINPHFLFNTLNNIYGLSLENSKKVPKLILKLSDFLSFSLYESNQKSIPLSKEISLIEDFIALEQSRFEDRVNVNTLFPRISEDPIIPPLILVPFVENAFKHSVKDEIKSANISIKLNFDKSFINLIVNNSKPLSHEKTNTKNGLGLINIKKRLDIIYGKTYELKITDNEDSFNVNLKIPVK